MAKNFRTVDRTVDNDPLEGSFKDNMVQMQGNLMEGFGNIANMMNQMEGRLDQSQADLHNLNLVPQRSEIDQNRAMFRELQEMIKG